MIKAVRTARDYGTTKTAFFYDVLRLPDGSHFPMKIRSMVGLMPLFAVETLSQSRWSTCLGSSGEWFIENRPDLTGNVAA